MCYEFIFVRFSISFKTLWILTLFQQNVHLIFLFKNLIKNSFKESKLDELISKKIHYRFPIYKKMFLEIRILNLHFKVVIKSWNQLIWTFWSFKIQYKKFYEQITKKSFKKFLFFSCLNNWFYNFDDLDRNASINLEYSLLHKVS